MAGSAAGAVMSLLPDSHAEFRSKAYWDKFFTERSTSFEWYGEWLHLRDLMLAYSKPSSKVLVIGCGNSEMSAHLYDAGRPQIVNIDFSEPVIADMAARHAMRRPSMQWRVMDFLKMADELGDASFDVVVDKGALDALVASDEASVLADGGQLCAQVARVLRPGGVYLCVSLLQPNVLATLVTSFGDGWQVVVRPFDSSVAAEEPAAGDAAALMAAASGSVKRGRRSPLQPFWVVIRRAPGGTAAKAVAAAAAAAGGSTPAGPVDMDDLDDDDAGDSRQAAQASAVPVAALLAGVNASGAAGMRSGEGAAAAEAPPRGELALEEVTTEFPWIDLAAAVAAQVFVLPMFVPNPLAAASLAARKAIVRADMEAVVGGAAESSLGSLLEAVGAPQWRNRLLFAARQTRRGRELRMDLWGAVGGPSPRFSLVVADVADDRHTCAAILVPQGREHEWHFASPQGRADLARSANVARVILVLLGRGHVFESQEAVRAEVAPQLAEFGPEGAVDAIPVMAVADGLGQCIEVCRVQTAQSGVLVVEDAEADEPGRWSRRLVFDSNKSAVQTECTVVAVSKASRRRRKKQPQPSAAKAAAGASEARPCAALAAALADLPAATDHAGLKPAHLVAAGAQRQLRFEYHEAMVAALALVLPAATADDAAAAAPTAAPAAARVLVLGLGGGALAGFLGEHLSDRVAIEAVELDPAVAAVAERFFGEASARSREVGAQDADRPGWWAPLPSTNESFRLSIGDGLERVANIAAASAGGAADGSLAPLQALVVDVDAKDPRQLSQGISFPPASFTSAAFLRQAGGSLSRGGLLLLNVACRDEEQFGGIVSRCRREFVAVHTVPIVEGALNRLVVCQWPRSTAAGDASTPTSAGEAVARARAAWAGRKVGGVDMAAWLGKLVSDPAAAAGAAAGAPGGAGGSAKGGKAKGGKRKGGKKKKAGGR